MNTDMKNGQYEENLSRKLLTVARIYLIENEDQDIYVGAECNHNLLEPKIVQEMAESLNEVMMSMEDDLFNTIYSTNAILAEYKMEENKKYVEIHFNELLPIQNIGEIQ